jgi:putative ABC transport system permease protein
MLKNYLKIAWRNLVVNKTFSLINIGGLAVGMAVAMIIGLWIWDELSFDKNFENYDHIAFVIQNITSNNVKETRFQVPFPLGNELRNNYGKDFKHIVMSSNSETHVLSADDKKFSETGYFMEPDVIDMLNIKLVKGSKEGLKDPSSIMLSEAVAKACFGDNDPINKTLKIDDSLSVKVTGVYQNMPYSSSFADLTFIAPWDFYVRQANLMKRKNPWRGNAFLLITQLADNVDMDKVSQRIRDVKMRKINKAEQVQNPQLFLFPMHDWHLRSQFVNGVNAGGGIQYVWLFGTIGIFVLVLACINFMNLSTARSEKRSVEVGIRKAIGSSQKLLIYQFFTEAFVMVSFAFLLSLLMIQLALPFFNEVAGKVMVIPWGNPFFWLFSFSFALFTGLISGSYPAFYLSSFQPTKVLKGVFKVGRFAALPRKVLIVLQFTVSIVLIIGTIIVLRQIQFAKNRPVGYDRQGLVILPMSSNDVHTRITAVKDELMETGVVSAVAECESATTDIYGSNGGFEWPGKDPNLAVDFPNTKVSQDYGKTVGWQFEEGRDFSEKFPSDSLAFVINESAAKFMGLKNPVGQTVKLDGTPYQIIGVIKNMIQESPYQPVRPSFYRLSGKRGNYVAIKINPAKSASEAMDKIGTVFKKYNPSQPFEYQFADEAYGKKFGNEERIGKLASFFACLTILISCLGLFGMASFTAEQRIKEIGIRKVLGASVFSIWLLLSKNFVTLISISLIIATPVSYTFMHKWLQRYQFRTDIDWWIFLLTGTGALAITILTVSYQSIKAALTNPSKSLKAD